MELLSVTNLTIEDVIRNYKKRRNVTSWEDIVLDADELQAALDYVPRRRFLFWKVDETNRDRWSTRRPEWDLLYNRDQLAKSRDRYADDQHAKYIILYYRQILARAKA
jgi:hypothetical protein